MRLLSNYRQAAATATNCSQTDSRMKLLSRSQVLTSVFTAGSATTSVLSVSSLTRCKANSPFESATSSTTGDSTKWIRKLWKTIYQATSELLVSIEGIDWLQFAVNDQLEPKLLTCILHRWCQAEGHCPLRPFCQPSEPLRRCCSRRYLQHFPPH